MGILRAAIALPVGISRFSPAGLASSGTEHGEQAAFFAWSSRAYWLGVQIADDMEGYGNANCAAEIKQRIADRDPALPELRWLHAVPNGGERDKATAGIMKAEGVKRGVSDVAWPFPCGGFHGLYIELKRRNGVPSDLSAEQSEFGRDMLAMGYYWQWCRGWIDARNTLVHYAQAATFGATK